MICQTGVLFLGHPVVQSQKSQGFSVADFATLSDEGRSCSKIFLLFNMGKRPLRENSWDFAN